MLALPAIYVNATKCQKQVVSNISIRAICPQQACLPRFPLFSFNNEMAFLSKMNILNIQMLKFSKEQEDTHEHVSKYNIKKA